MEQTLGLAHGCCKLELSSVVDEAFANVHVMTTHSPVVSTTCYAFPVPGMQGSSMSLGTTT